MIQNYENLIIHLIRETRNKSIEFAGISWKLCGLTKKLHPITGYSID